MVPQERAALIAADSSSKKWTVILILGLAAMFSVGLTLSEIFGCG